MLDENEEKIAKSLTSKYIRIMTKDETLYKTFYDEKQDEVNRFQKGETIRSKTISEENICVICSSRSVSSLAEIVHHFKIHHRDLFKSEILYSNTNSNIAK